MTELGRYFQGARKVVTGVGEERETPLVLLWQRNAGELFKEEVEQGRLERARE